MSLYTIADLHLSFAQDKPMDIFGSRWQHHAAQIEARWRETVGQEDTVIVAGDLSWGIDLEQAKEDLLFLDSLPGKKWLLKGNHDYWWTTVEKMEAFFFGNKIESLSFLYNRALTHGRYTLCGARGWFQDEKHAPRDADYPKIVAREAGRLRLSLEDGKKRALEAQIPFVPLAFLHFPPVFLDDTCPEILSVLSEYGVRDCYYGHIHGKYDLPPTVEYQGIRFHIISADYLQFRPMQIDV